MKPHVELPNVLGALIGTAEEISVDPTLPEDVRVFAAAVTPFLRSLDYNPPHTRQGDSDLLTMAAIATQGVTGDPDDEDTGPPIWAN
jgi:hypothetical protein